MRRIYCDESGTGQDRILVVAGVIVHGDSQWYPLEQRIAELVDKHVADEDRPGFFFHATEIFSGTGKVFGNRNKYPLNRRIAALNDLLSIPSKFRLPVVCGFIRRQPAPPNQTTQDRRDAVSVDQAVAGCYCTIAAERFMRRHAQPAELAEMILEDNTETKKSVDRMQNVLRSAHPDEVIASFQNDTTTHLKLNRDFLPLTKISESISWKGKRGSRLLQIADVCAFIIRQYIEERQDIANFVSAFTPAGPQRIADIQKVRDSGGGMLEIKCWD